MARITNRLKSDFTGAEADEGEFVTVIVRSHPKVTDPKRLDALPAELDQLKSAGDLVSLEIKNSDGSTRDVHVKYSDFAKLVSDDVLAASPGTTGRRPGYSPRANGNGH